MSKKGIKLGDEIEDVVTKARGIATGKVTYLDGSVYWIIQPPYDESEKVDSSHSPEAYCKRVGNGVYPDIKPIMGFHVKDLESK